MAICWIEKIRLEQCCVAGSMATNSTLTAQSGADDAEAATQRTTTTRNVPSVSNQTSTMMTAPKASPPALTHIPAPTVGKITLQMMLAAR